MIAIYQEHEMDGQWIAPIPKEFKFTCPDCGLTHNIDFGKGDGSGFYVRLRITLDRRMTNRIRDRHSSIQKVSGKRNKDILILIINQDNENEG